MGMAEGAVGVARSDLEAGPATTLPDRDADVLLICELGGRSLKAAQVLIDAGYRRVASVDGGPFAPEPFVPEAAKQRGRTEL